MSEIKQDIPGPEGKTGEWNSKLEDAAREIGQSSQGYKHMHIWQAQLATRYYRLLTGAGIVIGPMASVISSVGVALEMESDPAISIFVILLGFLSGIVVAAVKFGKYEEAGNANKSAAARYTSIEANVRRQLGLYRNDRLPSISYMDWLGTKYEEVMMSAPLLSAGTYKRYSRYANKKGLEIPGKYERKISVNEEYVPQREIKQEDVKITIPEDKTKRKKSVMAKIPEINCASDKMLAYEMSRMMGNR